MKLTVVDAVLGFFILLGVIMTAINFFATRGPTSEIVDSEIREIAPPPPPVHKKFGQPIADKKPQIKMSEARAIVRQYVEEMSELPNSGVITKEKQDKLVEDILANMEKQGIYDFVD